MRRPTATPIHKPLDAASTPSPHAPAAARPTRKGRALRLGEATVPAAPVVVGTALVAICLAAGPAVSPSAALADAEVPIPCAAPSGGDNGGSTPAEPGDGGAPDNPSDPGDAGGDGDWGNGGSADWGGAGGDYDYTDSWGGSAQQAATAGGPDKPVPNVIVSSFSYGDGTGAVAAGSEFPLTFAFTNTSTSLAVENLVVSVDTGDQFTINGGTNTFYSASLGANAVQQQTLSLKAISSEKAVPGTLTISFKYEYVENNERKSANTEVKLTVPVYQPDRFELSAPTPPEGAMVGSESTVTLSYVNKGKSAVSNVAVSVSSEGISTQTPQQNVGNIESGNRGHRLRRRRGGPLHAAAARQAPGGLLQRRRDGPGRRHGRDRRARHPRPAHRQDARAHLLSGHREGRRHIPCRRCGEADPADGLLHVLHGVHPRAHGAAGGPAHVEHGIGPAAIFCEKHRGTLRNFRQHIRVATQL